MTVRIALWSIAIALPLIVFLFVVQRAHARRAPEAAPAQQNLSDGVTLLDDAVPAVIETASFGLG